MARKNLSSLSSIGAEEPSETPELATQPEIASPPRASKPADQNQPAPATRPARRAPAASKTTAASAGEEGGPAAKGVPVHLTEELNERLKAHMARKKRSHQTVLMDAIEATYTRLPELVAEATLSGEEDTERTPLFERTPTRPAPSTSGQARHKHTVRMTARNRQILDTITEEVGAPSRNFLITVAYEAYLPTIEKS